MAASSVCVDAVKQSTRFTGVNNYQGDQTDISALHSSLKDTSAHLGSCQVHVLWISTGGLHESIRPCHLDRTEATRQMIACIEALFDAECGSQSIC